MNQWPDNLKLIAYRMLVWDAERGGYREKEHGHATEARLKELEEKYKGTGYRLRVWPPQNNRWRKI